MKLWKSASMTIALTMSLSSHAALFSRFSGAAAYDDVLDITWISNAALSGVGTWDTQVAWVNNLNYLGFNDWRLASMSVGAGLPNGPAAYIVNCASATELECRDNELGYMAYYNIGGHNGGFTDFSGDHVIGDVTITNVSSSSWSGTEYYSGGAASFFFYGGAQGVNLSKNGTSQGWAVRSGDVGLEDTDTDGVPDSTDNCPVNANVDQFDTDSDGFGDACDADDDADGVEDDIDNCPVTSNSGQNDTDYDYAGDACDDDDDNDGVADSIDNCSLIVNSDQTDEDSDGQGDICDGDLDGDGFGNDADNCPNIANTNQNDFDGDAQGDVCDDDADGDTVENDIDLCAETPIDEIVEQSSGCSLVQLVPCNGPMGSSSSWRNHGQYVSLLNKTAKNFVDQSLISSIEHGLLSSEAAHSACGQK